MATEYHIRSARPVPSSIIAKSLKVSSATVRNDLSALEDEGYLHQPHTSAGRVPTMRAYQSYADKFIPPKKLSKAQKQHLLEALSGVHGDFLLRQIAQVTADLSGYAVVVRLPADDHVHALEIHLSLLSSSRLLAVIVLDTGLVRQLMITLDPAPSGEAVSEAESRLRQLTLPLAHLPQALLSIAKRSQEETARTLNALADNWHEVSPPRLFSQGLTNLLAEPESENPNFVREALEQVESPMENSSNEQQGDAVMPVIYFEEALALISAPLSLGQSRGELTLLGPLRMRYPEALMIAQGVTQTVAAEG